MGKSIGGGQKHEVVGQGRLGETVGRPSTMIVMQLERWMTGREEPRHYTVVAVGFSDVLAILLQTARR